MLDDLQNSGEDQDGEIASNARRYWQDYQTVRSDAENDDFEVRQRVFDPTLQPSPPPYADNHEVMTREERMIINHAPGRSEKSQSVRLAREDKIHITERYCEMLQLPRDQTRAAQRLMAELNLDKFGNQKRIEKMALVVIRHITNQARVHTPMDYSRRISANEVYKELIEENGMDLGDVMRLSHKLKQVLREREGDSVG